ncbi:MAG: hypothetical protein HY435_00545 [Candidatus Liptonbacteria bacterium]|nr:hypothetical protein [Candidatus Liptonbacteria bacterium]
MKKAIILLIVVVVIIVGWIFIAGRFFGFPDSFPKRTLPPPGDIEVSSEMDTSDWKTYRNETHRFEFKYPADWSVKGDTFKNANDQVVASISASNSANIGISYCAAHSLSQAPDTRCQFLSVDGNAVEVDWGVGNNVVVRFEIQGSIYFINFYKSFVETETIQQILSTFKFIQDTPLLFPPEPTQEEIERVKKLPKEQCPCWVEGQNVCLPQQSCI